MNHYAVQKNAFAAAVDRKTALICPKPRRLSPTPAADVTRPMRWHNSNQAEHCGSKAGLDFLDYFLPKGGESLSISPPIFCGSPPSRAKNPVVHDARFGENRSACPLPQPSLVLGGGATASPMSPRSSGNCARTNIGLKPAAVRIEGFDCLNGGRRRRCSITAVA